MVTGGSVSDGLVGDAEQGEGDGRLDAVQPVGEGDAEHRRLDVLRALAAGQQQFADPQGEVEHARHGRGGAALVLQPVAGRRGPLGRRAAGSSPASGPATARPPAAGRRGCPPAA